jgi:hypothetical protein
MQEPHKCGNFIQGRWERVRVNWKKFLDPAAKEDPLKNPAPNIKEWLSVSKWLGFWLIWKSTNNDTAENDQNICNTEELRAPFRNARPPKLYRLPLLLVCTVCDVFVTADILSNFKMPEPHGLCSVLPTAPLCSRDSDGCHFERTAAQWLGVRPGYPQVRNRSVLRWILCAAVGYVGTLARRAESHHCPSSWHTAVYIITKLQPTTQWY